jgi:hypothetical protein
MRRTSSSVYAVDPCFRRANLTQVKELLTRLETLEEQYRATRMDYDREIQYNRQGQVKEMQMAQELKDLRSEAVRLVRSNLSRALAYVDSIVTHSS